MLENHDSDNYHDKYLKIRFNLNENVPLEQKLELHNIVISIRYAF